MTVVRPRLQFGVAQLNGDGVVRGFAEKPRSEHWVNGGFFCFETSALDVFEADSVLEREPLERLAAAGDLRAYRHDGFWDCMDTYKDAVELNDLWAQGDAPWKLWDEARSDPTGSRLIEGCPDIPNGIRSSTRRRSSTPVAASSSPSWPGRSRSRRVRAAATPTGIPRLALAIQKARDASMPKDNIERAIAKGTGEGVDADQIETVLYEGYGPGGVALLIEALTDNRNRTGADVRHLLSKNGGNLGEPGSVSYLFDKRGVIVVDAERYDEDDLMPAIDAGAEDISLRRGRVRGDHRAGGSGAASARRSQRSGSRSRAPTSRQRPKSRVPLDEAEATKLLRLIDALEESDDVTAVHANFDVDARCSSGSPPRTAV